MLFNAAGAAGQFIVFVFAVGLPLQFALGALVALGRRLGGIAAAFLPLLLLAFGVGGFLLGIAESLGSIGGSEDPAWIAWYALQDRARACAPLVIGSAGALILAIPPALGAALGVMRRGATRWWAALLAAGGGLVGALAIALTARWFAEPAMAVAEALAVGILAVLCGVAVSDGAVPGRREPGLVAPRVGAAMYAVGGVAVFVGHVALVGFSATSALPDFETIYAHVGALDAQAAAFGWAPWTVAPGVLVAGMGLLPGLVLRRLRSVHPMVGLDAIAVVGSLTLLALLGGWGTLRWRLLSHLAGEQTAAVLEERGTLDVPHLAPVPARVLIAEPGHPRWILMREGGGVERAEVAGGLEEAARPIQRGDGLVLPPEMAMEDVYFTLADVQAGAFALVGCGPVAAQIWDAIDHDPLRAVGRCGAFPLLTRVTDTLDRPRVLIALKDRYVDNEGDVVPIVELTDLAGRDVLVRAQVDATVADFVALLDQARGARRVYLAWGVTLDGDSLPIGVNPGLAERLAGAAPPTGTAPETPPAVGVPE